MENITKDILKYLNNEHTKVELKEEFTGNYYSYIVDTIYIAKNFGNKKELPKVKNFNKKVAELIVICHECIHSIQNKGMHILNSIFSNCGIVLAITTIAMGIFGASPLSLKISTSIVLLASIIVRLILETHAVNNSVKLAKDIVANGIIKDVLDEEIQEGANFIHKHKFFEFFRMIVDKIIFLIFVLVIK